MFKKYSISIYKTKTKYRETCAFVEIYDNFLHISIDRKIIFTKQELIDFHVEFSDYFTEEENLMISQEIEELKLPKIIKSSKKPKFLEDNGFAQHETPTED